MKILLWKIGAMGDILMTTPLARQLRRAMPDARIEYLTGHRCAAVLEGNTDIDRVISFDESILFRARITRLGEVSRLLKGYDAIFVLDKHWIFELVAWQARVPARIGFMRRKHEGALHTHCVPYGELRHEIHYYLDLAQAWGIGVDFTDTRMWTPSGVPSTRPAPYIVLINSGGVNPGERSRVRQLPQALFGALVAHCAAAGPVVFVGGEHERGDYERHEGSGRTNLCGQTSLQEVCGLLANADAVYTTDSGLMHMAGAVNSNVTALFGPTHPARKCPPGTRWAWTDEDRYDSRYELFGTIPRESFFESMTLDHILAAAHSAPREIGEDA